MLSQVLWALQENTHKPLNTKKPPKYVGTGNKTEGKEKECKLSMCPSFVPSGFESMSKQDFSWSNAFWNSADTNFSKRIIFLVVVNPVRSKH